MTELDATPGNKIARLPFGLTPLPYFIGVACTVAMLAYMSNILKYLSRPDLLNLQLTFFGLTMGPVTILSLLLYQRARTAGRKDLIRLVNFVILLWIGYYAFQLDWNPGQQLRQPAPYESWEIPTEPMAKQAYDLAHSIELPDPYVPDDFYKPGLFGVFGRTTRFEYIKHLCANFSGEFIYESVDDVEGVYEMRPRTEARETEHLSDRYRMEDPYGYTTGMSGAAPAIFVGRPFAMFDFFETWQHPVDYRRLQRGRYADFQDEDYPYWRFTMPGRADDHKSLFHVTNIPNRTARYGFTWRGIKVPHGRENGIAGGELIVLELATSKVLAVRRGFTAAGTISNDQSGIRWDLGYFCPLALTESGKRVRGIGFDYLFVSRVLKPAGKIRGVE